jgi:hypothetical protein
MAAKRSQLKFDRVPDPSPEEIAAMCAEIREGWDEHRWKQGAQTIPASTPLVADPGVIYATRPLDGLVR